MVSDRPEDEARVRTAAQFATTHWSVVLAAGDSASPDSQEALEKLCRTYWFPLYAFVRRMGYGVEDAKDLTQEFFLRIIEKHRLPHANPDRGRFRTFILSALKHFLCDEWDRRQSVRRGGGTEFVPLDIALAETRYRVEQANNCAPDVAFDRNWAAAVLESALRTLETETRRANKEQLFQALAPCLTGDPLDEAYVLTGQRLGLSEAAVKMAVMRLRQRFRQLLQAEIEQTVTTKDQGAAELQHLAEVLRADW